jgi:hypothetical protein
VRKASALAIIVFVLGVAATGYRYVSAIQATPETFNTHQWRERSDQTRQNDPGCVRGGMALTLIQSGRLLDLSKEKVLEQLGQAEAEKVGQFRYSLGQCQWDWRHSTLVVTFKPNDTVADAFVLGE